MTDNGVAMQVDQTKKMSPPDDPELELVLRHALVDIGREASGVNDAAVKRFIVITPAKLRAYAERLSARYLRDHESALPSGVTIEVHSFSSFVDSVAGTRYAYPSLSPSKLRMFLYDRVRADGNLFPDIDDVDVFDTVAQFAAQIADLANDGITSEDLTKLPTANDEGTRLHRLRVLLGDVEREYLDPDTGVRYVMPGDVATSSAQWLERNGASTWIYLYGFEHLEASERLAVAAMKRHAHVWQDSGDGDGGNESGACARPTSAPEIAVTPANSVADEVRLVASRIAKIRKDQPHSRILVTARDLSRYAAMLEAECAYRGIPINMDAPDSMLDHPMATLALTLLDDDFYDVASTGHNTAVIRAFRTGLVCDDPDSDEPALKTSQLDSIENFLLDNDPQSVWMTVPADIVDEEGASERRIDKNNALRKSYALTQLIARFVAAADRQCRPRDGKTVHDTLTGFMDFVRRYVLEPKHGPRKPSYTRLVWDVIAQTCRELIDRYPGDHPFADIRPMFRRQLRAVLAANRLNGRPIALDAVDVRPYPTPVHMYDHVFVLGATESQIPAIRHETGLLDDSEREDLAARIADDPARSDTVRALLSRTVCKQSERERSAFDLLLAHAGTRLTVTYARSMDDSAQEPSRYIVDWLESKNQENVPKVTDADLTHPIDGKLLTLPDTYLPLGRELAERLFLRAAKQDDGRFPSKNDNADALALDVSVSSIEMYYGNPYDYFLRHGLRIRPRERFELDAAVEGLFYHAMLEHAMKDRKPSQPIRDLLADYLDENTPSWNPLDDQDMGVLRSSNRLKAFNAQMSETVAKSVDYLDALYAGVDSSVVATEQQFAVPQGGRDADDGSVWPAIRVPLGMADGPDGVRLPVTMYVNGKIDRLDEINVDGRRSLLVLDYKSSGKVFLNPKAQDSTVSGSASDIFYGHELQLLTYAKAAQDNAGPVAGLFFVPIKRKEGIKVDYADFCKHVNPSLPGVVDATVRLQGTTGDGTDIHLTLAGLKRYGPWNMDVKQSGVAVGDWHFQNAQSQCVDEQQLDTAIEHAQKKIRQAAEQILNGVLPISPYRTDQKDGLQYSDFKDVMALDTITGSAFRYERAVGFSDVFGEAASVAENAQADAIPAKQPAKTSKSKRTSKKKAE